MRSPLPNTRRHFFKFIRPGFLFQVPVPETFAEYLNSRKCELVVLRREGQTWPVKIDRGLVFGEGWEKFVKDNGVQECDFVVFKHEEKKVFEVMVFENPSTCERNYPPLEFPESKSYNEHKEMNGSKKIPRGDAVPDYDSGRENVPFKSGQGPYFESTLTACNIRTSNLYIPLKFARLNGLIERKCDMIIRDEKKRSWQVRLMRKYHHYTQISGCKDFRIANGLKEGDKFMLQLVDNGKKPIMNFRTITTKEFEPGAKRKDKGSNSLRGKLLEPSVKVNTEDVDLIHKPTIKPRVESSYCLKDRRVKAETRDSDLTCTPIAKTQAEHSYCLRNKRRIQAEETTMTSTLAGHPSFISFVTPSNIASATLYIPMKFARSNGLKDRKCEIIMRDSEQRSWPMNLKTCGDHVCVTRWGDLLNAYGVKAGDPFMIELIKNGNKPIMNFHDLRQKPLETDANAGINVRKNPYFVSTLKLCSIKQSLLYLPKEFAVSNGLSEGEMILRNKTQESWTVEVRNALGHTYIGRGWRDFCVANKLKDGDSFEFELVETGKTPVAVLSCMLL